MIYDYKDIKENEISSLKKAQEKLHENIHQSNKDYEKILDNTTSQIENFLNKLDKNNPIA